MYWDCTTNQDPWIQCQRLLCPSLAEIPPQASSLFLQLQVRSSIGLFGFVFFHISFNCLLSFSNCVVWSKLRVIVCTCHDSHILFRAKITNEAITKRRVCFRQYLSSQHNLGFTINSLPDNSSVPYFTHLFIDEAAQASEPEILIPMSCVIDPYPGPKKAEVALIGDPRQLRWV